MQQVSEAGVEGALILRSIRIMNNRFRWPHRSPGTRCWDCVLEFRWGAWLSVSCACCVLQVELSAKGQSLVQRSPSVCV